MKALVTGVAGFIGSTLAERLLADGADVVGIDCFTDYYPRPIKERNLAGLRGAAAASASSNRAIQDADLARAARRSHPRLPPGGAGGRAQELGTRLRRLHGQQHRGDAGAARGRASAQRLERLVYASSSSVYGDDVAMPMREDALPQPVSPYGVTKLAAEQLCYLYHVNYGVPTVSLRYFTVYGPRQRPDMGFHKFLRATLAGEPITVYGDGEQTRDFTFVADAVAATVAAATRGVPGRVYNIGGGSRVSVNQVLEMIGRVSGRRPLDHRRSGAEGRHAAHVRRYVARARRPRLRAHRRARGRASRRNTSGWREFCEHA